MAMKCKKHGDVPSDQCYIWNYIHKGRQTKKFACKQCTKDRQHDKYLKKIPVVKKDLDWTGQKFGLLTFVRKTEKRIHRAVLWELKCDCGEIVLRRAYFVIRGISDNCGCMTKKRRAFAGSKSRILDPRISSAKSIWVRVYNDGCDFETFLRLSQLQCTYCGKPPSRTYNKYTSDKRHPKLDSADFTYNGLDRIDNLRDHSPDNVVTCCTDCNRMKMDKSVDEFLNHVKEIYLYQLAIS